MSRRKLPKVRKLPKIECNPPPSRESQTPFKPVYWEPEADLPPNIQSVPRCPGCRIYTCTTCGLVETSILKDEAELLLFVNYHKENSPKCFNEQKPDLITKA